jgi:hypothetical protein
VLFTDRPRRLSGKLFGSLSADTLTGAALAFGSFVVYLLTLSRKVGPEDAGELAASAHALGISHPTGYPLFHLMGRAFTMLPPDGWRVIVKLNLMGAVLCALAVFVLYRLFVALLRPHPFGAPNHGAGPGLDGSPLVHRIGAACGALTFAFSRTVWANATSVEVYALHVLCLGLVLLTFARALRAHAGGEAAAFRWWLLFVYVLGLSFSNHMMTVLLGPALLYAYFTTHGLGAAAWRKIASAVPVFLLALSSYLYLPVRASVAPVINWGDPSTWARFKSHVTGEFFQGSMFSSAGVFLDKAGEIGGGLPGSFGPAALAAAGLWFLGRASRRVLVFGALIFLTCVVYTFGYDFDDPNYYLNALLVLSLGCAAGVAGLSARVARRFAPQRETMVAGVLAGMVILSLLPLHWIAESRKGDDMVEDYAREVLVSLQKDATLASGDWHLLCGPSLYLQHVEGLRPDVVVLCMSLLNQLWYYKQVEAEHPGFVSEVSHRFERDVVNGMPTKAMVDNGFKALVLDRIPGRPFYFCQRLSGLRQAGFVTVPEGLVIRVFADSVPSGFIPPEPGAGLETGSSDGRFADKVREVQAHAYLTLADFHDARGNTGKVIEYLQKALLLQPDRADAREWLRARRGY